jgi:hypothetical protein
MLYIIHNPKIWDNNCPLGTSDLLKVFQRNGTTLLDYESFMKQEFLPDDSIVIFISMNDPRHREKLKSLPCRKFVISGDEAKSDMIIFNNEIHLHDELGIECVITAQKAQQNLNVLKKHDIRFIHLPGVIKSNIVNGFPNKLYDIFLSGNATHTYPLRLRVREALSKATNEFHILYLPFGGYEISNNRTGIYGDSFVKLASQCWLGLVDKCGAHDRLVAKYYEFGMAYCLPMGNSPSSMDIELSSEMLQIDINWNNKQIIDSIHNTLEDKSRVTRRAMNYHDHMIKHNDIEKTIPEVISKILTRSYDM